MTKEEMMSIGKDSYLQGMEDFANAMKNEAIKLIIKFIDSYVEESKKLMKRSMEQPK